MHRLLASLRRALKDDPVRAYADERGAWEALRAAPGVDGRFRAEMASAARDRGRVRLGTSARDDTINVSLGLSEVAGAGHTLVVGGSGSGKTRAVAGLVREIHRRRLAGLEAPAVAVMDHKSEFAALIRDLYADLLPTLDAETLRRALDDFVVINPFSDRHFVPMQVLKREPGVAPEVQAYEVTTLVSRAAGADLGVRQDSFLYTLVLLGVLRGLTLVDLTRLLSDSEHLRRLAETTPHEDVRAYFARANQISRESLEGVRARLQRILRLPSAARMLGAGDSVSLSSLLGRKTLIIDVGSPHLGCEDIGRFYAGAFTLKLTRAIFMRSQVEAETPVALFVDEWQEGLAAGGDIAENYERVLAMARSRRVRLWLVSQSLAVAGRVSSSLPRVVATNTDLQLLFRANHEDARELAHVLPITGRRLREDAGRSHDRREQPFLSKAEEREALVTEATRLPDRTFYLWNRRKPYGAELVRAAEVTVSHGVARSAHRDALERGALAISIPAGQPTDEQRREPVLRRASPAETPAAQTDTSRTSVSRRPRRTRES